MRHSYTTSKHYIKLFITNHCLITDALIDHLSVSMAEELEREEEGFEEVEEDSIDILEENPDCVMVQVANDHDMIKGLYRRYKDPTLSDKEHQRIVWEMIRALCVHMYAEEEVLCPAFAEEISEAARAHALDVDESLKLLLSDVDSMAVGQEGFGAKVEQLMEVFFEHLAAEEHLMPELREAVGPERLMELGGRFKAAKEHVPTRPHPSAPDSILAHIALAPLDYVRDRWRGMAPHSG